jgi:hypothetical protein
LFATGALGEFGVGLALLAFPGEVTSRALDTSLAATDFVLGRVFGLALIALGLTWWGACKERDGRPSGPIATGFIAYNLGAGLLMALQALAAVHAVPIVWFAALLHLALGLAFSLAVLSWSKAVASGSDSRTMESSGTSGTRS